ncbi:MAG: F0F1 ATP synthase subunit A [Planctomycetia bacterium]|nr:F0F1 ATP synthase subunit A [Planctomycetia bacterium]
MANSHTDAHDQATDSGHEHAHNPFEKSHLIGHVKDAEYFDVPRALGEKWQIPQLFRTSEPIVTLRVGFKPIDERIEPLELKITKFMVLETLAAVVMVLLFVGLAARIRKGAAPKGKLTNLLEAMVVYIRDEVARPAIGRHDADRFLPFLLTIFFFVLVLNLFGLVPWFGSATGALATTGTMATLTFATVVVAGMAKLGPVKFWLAQVPHMELPLPIAVVLKPMIFFIELLGLCIKHFILAMRLLANMMAGHLVLAVILAFIAASASSVVWYAVTPASVLGLVALSLLELLVAFIQAYIFTFLSALFIGMAVHPH